MLSRDFLIECLSYDEITGDIFWNERPRSHFNSDSGYLNFQSQFSNSKSGTENYDGYSRIRITDPRSGKEFAINYHEIAWIFCYGFIPDGFFIDHRNGNRQDNRIVNLRLCTKTQNNRNRKKCKNKEYRFKGVYLSGGRWMAQICISKDGIRKRKTLRSGSELQCAIDYDKLCAMHHAKFANLNLPCMRIVDFDFIEISVYQKRIS